MSFISPEYFWLLLFILVALVKRDLKVISYTRLSYLFVFVLLVIALARPVIEEKPIETQEYLSDVVLGVDLSYSMQAQDVTPSRLEAAKTSLEEIVHSEQKSRFGVMAFTTNAIVLSPLTSDSSLLLHLFSMLDYKLIMTRGSSIMPTLKLARKMSHAKELSVVLLTDGADELNYADEIAYAKEHHLRVNILMIATKLGGTLQLENGELLKDELDEIIVSRENGAIEALANATGGVYSHSVEDILSALNAQRDETHKSSVTLVQNRELFYYFIAFALLIFMLAITKGKAYVLSFLLLIGISLDADSFDFLKNQNRVAFEEGVAYYKEGEYEKALNAFSLVKSASPQVKSTLYFNIANSLVRLKEFEKAREAYEKSLILAYSKEADENLLYIKNVAEQKDMSTGQQKTAKHSDTAKQRENSQKGDKGGSSNMKVSASSGSGAQDKGKKSRSAPKVDLNSGKAKLSSKQYELINKRRVDEKKPY
ncbi:MAG: VWA domain-containing protein [Campylobacterales bacterium]|nr:VWA domain-containing protein [Campylobacterales bacterium]